MTRFALPEESLLALARHARQADEERLWPVSSWDVLRDIGALRWAIPRAYGGDEIAGVELLARYEDLASACLTSCFILSQRDAACRRLRDSGHEDLCRELFPDLAAGETVTTVGLAQLTTSRQHGKPALVAREQKSDFVIDGTIPWVTAAPQADHIVMGAVLEEGRQMLAVLPMNLPGVMIGPPLELMALNGSLTAEVRCTNVRLRKEWLLAGPAERVLQAGRGGTGGLETSCLALGVARAAIERLAREAELRAELSADAQRLRKTHAGLREELHRLAREGTDPTGAERMRARANRLVLQASQAALVASKGTGFVKDHPAQRWARQALFFLVWSCPWPVAAETLTYLAGAEPHCP